MLSVPIAGNQDVVTAADIQQLDLHSWAMVWKVSWCLAAGGVCLLK